MIMHCALDLVVEDDCSLTYRLVGDSGLMERFPNLFGAMASIIHYDFFKSALLRDVTDLKKIKKLKTPENEGERS